MNFIIACISHDVPCDHLRTADKNVTTVLLNYSHNRSHQLSACEWQGPRCIVRDISISNEGKWKNIHRHLPELTDSITENSFFWFPDPDIKFSSMLPGLLFAFMADLRLSIAQPSLSPDSVCCHPYFHSQSGGARKVPFCEIMCPAFSLDALRRNYWTFNLNHSGYGIDLLWGTKEDCFCLDQISVRHTRPPDYHRTALDAGFPDPQLELDEMKRRFRLHDPNP